MAFAFSKLADVDDFITSFVVDPQIGYQTRKMCDTFPPFLLNEKGKLLEIIQRCNTSKYNYEQAWKAFYGIREVRQHVRKVNWVMEADIKNQFEMYCPSFMPCKSDPGPTFNIRACNRYSMEGHKGATVVTTRGWRKGEKITGLIGTRVPIPEKYIIKGKNDFSIMRCENTGKSLLMLGPLRYVNHSCEPNIKWDIISKFSIGVTALTDIAPGGVELFVDYGDNYFGDSCECRLHVEMGLKKEAISRLPGLKVIITQLGDKDLAAHIGQNSNNQQSSMVRSSKSIQNDTNSCGPVCPYCPGKRRFFNIGFLRRHITHCHRDQADVNSKIFNKKH